MPTLHVTKHSICLPNARAVGGRQGRARSGFKGGMLVALQRSG
jgi:hypothetical protein